jgi:hypothetical protein
MREYNQFLAWRGIDRQYVWARSDPQNGSFAYRMVFWIRPVPP